MTAPIHEVISALYSLDHSVSSLEPILDRLCDAIGARHAIVGYRDGVRDGQWDAASERMRELIPTPDWADHMARSQELYQQSFVRAVEAGPEQLHANTELFADTRYAAAMEHWNDDIQKFLGYSTLLGGAFGLESSERGFLGLGFEDTRHVSLDTLKAENNFWLMHFSAAARLHQRLQRSRAMEIALAQFKWGVLVQDDLGRIIYQNLSAERILASQNKFRVSGDNFEGPTEFLRKLKDISAPKTFLNRRNFVQVVSDVGQGVSYVLFATRFVDGERTLCGLGGGTLIFMLDVTNDLTDAIRIASLLYQLTPAESETLRLSLMGATRQEIADRRNVSPETIKSQVASILQKMRCQRMTNVIALVSMLDPPNTGEF